jgi:hypothetical protein
MKVRKKSIASGSPHSVEFTQEKEGNNKRRTFRLTTSRGWVFVVAIFVIAIVFVAAFLTFVTIEWFKSH